MERYIDVENVDLETIRTSHMGYSSKADISDWLNEQPTADVEEVKHGCWKDRYDNKYYNHLYECSVCGKEALYECYKNELDQWNERQALTPICPHCGAKMDGGKAE